MRPPLRWALLAIAVAPADALRSQATRPACMANDTDLVSYALMTQRVCEFNYALDPSMRLRHPDVTVHGVSWADTATVAGCWALQRYNSDMYLSSAVYQNGGRCVLAISGYHAVINGPEAAAKAAIEPAGRLAMCKNEVHAPLVKQFRDHAASANWSGIVEYLGGRGSTCRNVVVTGDSMGGSLAELLAGCASLSRLDELQGQHLPSFKVDALYTFGAYGSSVKPSRNASSKDGCMKGKRVFHTKDMFAQWARGLGLKHAHMDAMRLSESGAHELLPCAEPGTASSDAVMFEAAPSGPAELIKGFMRLRGALSSHTITSYVRKVKGMAELGAAPQLRAIDYAGLLKDMKL